MFCHRDSVISRVYDTIYGKSHRILEELHDIASLFFDLRFDCMVKKILLLSANPTNTSKLRLDEEVREIEAGLERAKGRDEFKIIPKLTELLCDWSVLIIKLLFRKNT